MALQLTLTALWHHGSLSLHCCSLSRHHSSHSLHCSSLSWHRSSLSWHHSSCCTAVHMALQLTLTTPQLTAAHMTPQLTLSDTEAHSYCTTAHTALQLTRRSSLSPHCNSLSLRHSSHSLRGGRHWVSQHSCVPSRAPGHFQSSLTLLARARLCHIRA